MVNLLCFQSFPKGEAEVGKCEGTRRGKRLESLGEEGVKMREERERERERRARESGNLSEKVMNNYTLLRLRLA